MHKLFLFLAFALISCVILAQGPTVVNGKKPTTPKASIPTTDIPKVKPDPSRGSCCLSIDNWTGYMVDVWINDEYIGRIEPWGNSGLCMIDVTAKWYARSIGDSYEWSGEGQCQGEFAIQIGEDEKD
jgi:hypothetical protein